MICGLLESSLQGASNRTIFMSFRSTDGEILAIYCLETFVNNFLSTDSKGMKIVRLDAPWKDASNES